MSPPCPPKFQAEPQAQAALPESQRLRTGCYLNLLNANAVLHRLSQAPEGLSGLEMRILALTEEYLGVAT